MQVTPTPEGFANVTSGVTGGFASSADLIGVLGSIAIVAVLLLTVSYAATSVERYERIHAVLKGIVASFYYAGWGFVGVVVLGVPAAAAYWVGSQPAAARIEWMTYGGYVLAGFLALAAFGWVVERIVAALRARHVEYQDREPSPEPAAEEAGD